MSFIVHYLKGHKGTLGLAFVPHKHDENKTITTNINRKNEKMTI